MKTRAFPAHTSLFIMPQLVRIAGDLLIADLICIQTDAPPIILMSIRDLNGSKKRN